MGRTRAHRVPVLDSDLAFWRGLGRARGPRSSASHKCVGLTQRTATDPVAPWSAWTNKAINHWPCRRSSGRPPPSWVEQLHAVRLWEHHILPFGVSHFGVRCLEHSRPHAGSRTIYYAHSSIAPARQCLGWIALFHEQLCSTAVGHLSTKSVSGVSVAPAWQNIASPYGDLTNASFAPSSPASAS